MHRKLKLIDYITSVVATILWFLGGLIFLAVVRAAFVAAIPLNVRNNNKSTLGVLFLLLIFSAFVFGAWLVVSKLLPLFMAKTNQVDARQTTHLFLKLSAVSILALMLGDTLNHDSLLVGYSFWAIGLAGVYLLARYNGAR
jgi:heme A synthase